MQCSRFPGSSARKIEQRPQRVVTLETASDLRFTTSEMPCLRRATNSLRCSGVRHWHDRPWRGCARTGRCGPGATPLQCSCVPIAADSQACAAIAPPSSSSPSSPRSTAPRRASPDSCRSISTAIAGRRGSPGQTSFSSACLMPGWDCSMPGRHAPGRRIRPTSAPPDSSSRRPLRMVGRDKPVASETSASPPYPMARDSVAARIRRPRSLRYVSTAAYFSTIDASSSRLRCIDMGLEHNRA